MLKRMDFLKNKDNWIMLIGGILVLLILIFVYSLRKTQVVHLRSELKSFDSQIQQIESSFNKTKSIEGNLAYLKERYQSLTSKFPQKDEDGLRALSDIARQYNIEIVSLRPQPKTPCVFDGQKKDTIEGKSCQKLQISIDMKANYRDLVRAIEAFQESNLIFITVERLKIGSNLSGKLFITLDLNLYLLS